jgi:predicted amidohydrolase
VGERGVASAPWNPQPDFLIAARAAELGVPIASASKWGQEQETTFVGSSLVCNADGQVVAPLRGI